MLKKKKTMASGKPVLVKSVRRHWTSGGCPLSADRSGTETAQPQNEILCSKGLGGACPFCFRPLSVRYFFSISSCKSRLTWV